MIWFETPNPLLKIVDISKIKSEISNENIKYDNTFASPYNQQPLKLGADVVVHSSTNIFEVILI